MPIEKEVFDKALKPKETVAKFLADKKGDGKGYSVKDIQNATGVDFEVDKALKELLEEKTIEMVRKGGNNYYRHK